MIAKGKHTQIKQKSQRKSLPKRKVIIDYPREGEIITSLAYTFRIGATNAESVEVSLNEKKWHSCRKSVGYWWYDWTGYQSKPYKIEARISVKGKRSIKSKPRHVTALI